MNIKSSFNKLISQPSKKKYFRIIPMQILSNQQHSEYKMSPDKGYFQIRLSEMFLKKRRVFWNGFIPMVITLSEFIYDDKKITVPVYVGNNLLETIDHYTKQKPVEYYNTNIIGPTPYRGGDVAFFIGLFRIQVSDLSLGLFSFLENIIRKYNIAQLGSYLSIADSIKAGLSPLLGIEEVKMLIGNRIAFSGILKDSNKFREGFLLYINSPYGDVQEKKLRIKNDRLYKRENGRKLVAYDEHDYCLLKVYSLPKRNDYSALGFNDLFKNAIKEISNGRIESANQKFLLLIQKVALSPDLIQEHRFKLVQLYTANFEKHKEVFNSVRFEIEKGNGAIRGNKSLLDASSNLKKMASISKKERLSKDTERGLLDVGKNIEYILGEDDLDNDLSDRQLNKQLDLLNGVSKVHEANATDLVKAISLSHGTYLS